MASIGEYYNLKKQVDSYTLSLLTPYIILTPAVNDSSEGFISKCVKKVTIKQDSDVILFNKVIA